MYKETCQQILKIILKISYIFFRKGKGHFCPKNMAKKDTPVFSKNPKDTSVPPKGTSDFKRTLLYVSF